MTSNHTAEIESCIRVRDCLEIRCNPPAETLSESDAHSSQFAAVLLRNVLERRRELALLGATGYRRAHIFAIVLAENTLLLGWGLAAGTFCAAVAIAPVVLERGGRLPGAAGAGLLLIAVFTAGLLSSVMATRAALRAPLLEALRAE